MIVARRLSPGSGAPCCVPEEARTRRVSAHGPSLIIHADLSELRARVETG